MSLHKKLFIPGIALIVLPISIGVASNALSDCFGHYAYVPFVLNIINTILSSLTEGIFGPVLLLLIPFGFVLCLWSYVVWRRNRGASKLSVLYGLMGIGVLTALIFLVFLSSLNAGRNKGPFASFKMYMFSFRAQAELHYDTHNDSYEGFCSSESYEDSQARFKVSMDDEFGGLLCNVAHLTLDCKDSDKEYVISAPLPRSGPEDGYFCVDSTGFAGNVTGLVEGKSCVSESDNE